MYSYIGQSRKTFLIFVFITTLFTGCYGTISSIAQTNWTNAHIQCRKEGKMLPNLVINTLFNETYFWTGHYTRLSGWIKIIGCFEETAVNTLEQISYEMHFPSAGLCQEVCLESNYFVFGLQVFCFSHDYS
uniref:C-type lectin domain-containing protein n=1 Tax=Magallana gigas TaxID=29159 RepID=A0A8W8MJL3_MAGGI